LYNNESHSSCYQFSVTVTKYLRSLTYKGKVLFWLPALEVPFYGWFLCFGSVVKRYMMVGTHGKAKIQSLQARKIKTDRKGCDLQSLSRAYP
jgi:hypothetical protein